MGFKEFYYSFWQNIDKKNNITYNKKTKALPNDIKHVKNISYGDHGDYNKLDLFYPKKCHKKLPVIVNFHGGGYVSGDKKFSEEFCAEYAKAGFAVINANYRLMAKDVDFMASLSDAYDALKFSIKMLKKYDIALTDDIILMGDSSGAHIASLLACINSSRILREIYKFNRTFKIKACIFNSPVFEMHKVKLFPFPTQFKDKLSYYSLTSAIKQLKSNFPPCVVISSKYDPLRSQTDRFIKACNKKNINVKLVPIDILKDLGHSANITYFKVKKSIKINNAVREHIKNLLKSECEEKN